MNGWFRRFDSGLRKHRRLVALAAYAGTAGLAYAGAFLIRFELTWPEAYNAVFWATLPVLLANRVAWAVALRLSNGRWRFVSTADVLRLFMATLAGTTGFVICLQLLPLGRAVPRSVVLLEAVLFCLGVAGLWLLYRTACERLRGANGTSAGPARRVLIVGAGAAGERLAREMLRGRTGFRPVAFADDDPTKLGMTVHGIPVVGVTAQIPEIVERRGVQEIVIAIPSAPPEVLRRIVEVCETAGRPVRVLPGIAEVLLGNVRLNQIRDVRIEDLLGREPIQLSLPELGHDLGDRAVLITGAAGSIGSEVARQVALHRPRVLVLFDQAETALFYLELELRDRHPDLCLVPIVGDITDAGAVERVFGTYRPDRVFHAAAYKHVPMMEANPREAIRNNVIGTWRVADAAGRFGSEKFILVSTDKAVRPANVMGATKRLAELIVLELQERFPDTAYGAVRFGNVLGSNGSVLPIFKRQLQEGKPLTVTHPEVTRYFMTIPEAVQLILQASLLPELRGRIAMLDMGQPVRIVDLARNLLRLSGLDPTNGRIVFTGLRPGEKLHEELAAPDEKATPTAVPKVLVLETPANTEGGLLAKLSTWERLFEAGRDNVVLTAFGQLFPGVNARMPTSVGTAVAAAVGAQSA